MWAIELFSHEISADKIDLPRNDQLTSLYIPPTAIQCLGTVGRVGQGQCTHQKVLGSNPDRYTRILSKIFFFPLIHMVIWHFI